MPEKERSSSGVDHCGSQRGLLCRLGAIAGLVMELDDSFLNTARMKSAPLGFDKNRLATQAESRQDPACRQRTGGTALHAAAQRSRGGLVRQQGSGFPAPAVDAAVAHDQRVCIAWGGQRSCRVLQAGLRLTISDVRHLGPVASQLQAYLGHIKVIEEL